MDVTLNEPRRNILFLSHVSDPLLLYACFSRYIKPSGGKPKSYEQCTVKDGVGKIFVSSMGINYDGTYKESAIVDQRLATSISVTYIAVRDPGQKGASEVGILLMYSRSVAAGGELDL